MTIYDYIISKEIVTDLCNEWHNYHANMGIYNSDL